MSVHTIADALAAAREAGVERLDAQLLLSACMQRSRAWLIANAEAPLPVAAANTFLSWLRRRAQGEPLAYILGEKEFHGLTLKVDVNVLVPRPDTETLVDWALDVLDGMQGSPRVLDLGTGSGAIALAIKHSRASAEVTAVERSEAALCVARANGRRLGLAVEWSLGHWWQPLAGRHFDIALSNPPYVAEGDQHLADLSHEPRSALTAGTDGLDDIRAIVAGAGEHLVPGGWLIIEHGHDQAERVREILEIAGFAGVQSRRDLAGIERCTGGRVPL